jgi:IS30 family transposase
MFTRIKCKAVALWKNLRGQKQKRKRYAGGRDRRGHILNRRPLRDGPLHIEARKQIGHWECDTVIGASHKGAVVTMVERKSGYAVITKVSNKTSKLVSSAIVDKLKPIAARVKILNYDNVKEFAGHGLIDQELNSTAYFARPFASLSVEAMRTLTTCCANTFQRSKPCRLSVMKK